MLIGANAQEYNNNSYHNCAHSEKTAGIAVARCLNNGYWNENVKVFTKEKKII